LQRVRGDDAVKSKWLYIGAAAAIGIILIVVITMQQMNKPEKVLETLEEAVQEDNPELLVDLIVPDEQSAEVSAASVQPLITYLGENNNSLQVIKDSLYDQIDKSDYSTTSQQISLIQDESQWGIFPNYKLYVKTGAIKLSGINEGDQVELTIEALKNPIEQDEEAVYGPILPGEYEVLVTIQNELGILTDELPTDVWGNDQISIILDTNKLVEEDEGVQKEIMQALDIFNHDVSAFSTSEFDLTAFTNVSGYLDEEQLFLTNEFELVKDYLDEIHSQYEGAIVNLDTLAISYFDNDWTAEIDAYVSYNEQIKFSDMDEFEDVSFEAVRSYALSYDEESAAWLIQDFFDREAERSEVDQWEHTQEMMMEDPPVLKWNKEGSGTSI
jgi:hypothetical protein